MRLQVLWESTTWRLINTDGRFRVYADGDFRGPEDVDAELLRNAGNNPPVDMESCRLLTKTCMLVEAVNNEPHSTRCGRMRLCCNLRHHSVILVEELRKPTTHGLFGQNRRFPSRDFSTGSRSWSSSLSVQVPRSVKDQQH
jgi:hypothetical protein